MSTKSPADAKPRQSKHITRANRPHIEKPTLPASTKKRAMPNKAPRIPDDRNDQTFLREQPTASNASNFVLSQNENNAISSLFKMSNLIAMDKTTQGIDQFIKSASALTSHIQGSDLEECFDNDFPGLIRVVQKILDLDDLAMGVLFSISDSSIGRWKAGISRPHSAVRTPICNAIAAQLRAKALKLQS